MGSMLGIGGASEPVLDADLGGETWQEPRRAAERRLELEASRDGNLRLNRKTQPPAGGNEQRTRRQPCVFSGGGHVLLGSDGLRRTELNGHRNEGVELAD